MAIINRKKNQVPDSEKDIQYYSKLFWKYFFYGLGGIALFFLFASWGLLGSMPSFEDLENPDSNLATEIISADWFPTLELFRSHTGRLLSSNSGFLILSKGKFQ